MMPDRKRTLNLWPPDYIVGAALVALVFAALVWAAAQCGFPF